MQEKFYKPDSLWEVYNINSKEEFYKKINLSPKFHGCVPYDIGNEFKTIEYLIVLSSPQNSKLMFRVFYFISLIFERYEKKLLLFLIFSAYFIIKLFKQLRWLN